MDLALSGTYAYRIVHRNRSDIPDGQPRGWDPAQVPGGWTGNHNFFVNPLSDTEPGNWTGDVRAMLQVPGPTNPDDSGVTAVRNDDTGAPEKLTGDNRCPVQLPLPPVN